MDPLRELSPAQSPSRLTIHGNATGVNVTVCGGRVSRALALLGAVMMFVATDGLGAHTDGARGGTRAAAATSPRVSSDVFGGRQLVRGGVPSDTIGAYIGAITRAVAPAGVDTVAWRRATRIYAELGFTPLWYDARTRSMSTRADTLLRAVASSGAEGLRADDYPLHAVAAAHDESRSPPGPSSADAASRARLDVLLTAMLADFASDLLTGRLAPREVEPAWNIDAETVNVDSALAATLRDPDFAGALHRLRPRLGDYGALVTALARYRAIVRRGGWPTFPAGPALRPGDTSRHVAALRHRLVIEGYAAPGTAADSAMLDAELAGAVARFQASHGLETDSIVGPRTRRTLNVTAHYRVQQIIANLERLRWLPPRVGERSVVVNVPAFRLDAYERGQRVLTMRTVVGADYGHRATPIFSDSMRYVVFNPYWNVTANIAVNEILPPARRDREYLARNGYEIVEGWGVRSPVVNPPVLRNADFRSYRYRIRQRPGPTNALGRVKFMFPNDYNVYLHDTPFGELFAETKRAFSHGCIRVEHPVALAEFVLGPHGWARSAIDAAVASGVRREVALERAVPVFIIYLTAFAREDGTVGFRPDLYDHDAALLARLGPNPNT